MISTLPGIKDVAVAGKPDREMGKTVAAFIIAENDVNLTAEAIQSYCFERMTNHKIPKVINFVQEIPRTPTDKILKRGLRERL